MENKELEKKLKIKRIIILSLTAIDLILIILTMTLGILKISWSKYLMIPVFVLIFIIYIIYLLYKKEKKQYDSKFLDDDINDMLQ